MKFLTSDKLRALFPFAGLLVAFFIALTTIYFPLQFEEGINICKSSLEGIKNLYVLGSDKTYPAGSLFVENQPLYFFFLKIHSLIFTPAKISLKFFSLFFYILSFYFFFKLARYEYKNDFYALILTLILTVSPTLIFYSSHISEITLFYFLSVVQLMLFRQLESHQQNKLLTYMMVGVISSFVHYLAVIPFLLQLYFLRSHFFSLTKSQKRIVQYSLFLVFLNLLIHLPLMIYVKMQENWPIVSPWVLAKEYYENVILIGLGGGLVKGTLMSNIFPFLMGGLVFVSFYLHFKNVRKPLKTILSYHYLIILIGLVTLAFFKILLKVQNIELHLIIFILPSLYLILGEVFIKLKEKRNSAFFLILTIFIFFNLVCSETLLNKFGEDYDVTEKAMQFIHSKSEKNTIYTDNYWMAPCTIKSVYDSFYYPEKLTIKNLVELSSAENQKSQVIVIYNLNSIQISADSINESIDDPDGVYRVMDLKKGSRF